MTESVNALRAETRGMAKRAALAVLILASVATLGLLVVAVARPERTSFALRWWLLAVGATILTAAARLAANVLPAHGQTSFDRIQERRKTMPEPPERLRQIERFVTSAQHNRLEFRGRLRPILHAVAVQRLSAHRGIDVEQSPDAARAEFGERLWTLLTTSATAPDRDGPGIDLSELRALVDALEMLDDSGNAHD